MNKNYYKNIVAQLNKKTKDVEFTPKFPALKAYEYWIRFLRGNTHYPSPSEFIKILPFKSVLNILDAVKTVLQAENNQELAEIKKRGKKAISATKAKKHKSQINPDKDLDLEAILEITGKKLGPMHKAEPSGFDEEFEDQVSTEFHNRKSACIDMESAAESGYMDQVINSVRQHLDREAIYDKTVKNALQQQFITEASNFILEASAENDPYIQRLKSIQKIYQLTDLELEFLIFTWVFFFEKDCEDLVDFMRMNQQKLPNSAILFQQICEVPQEEIDKILDPKATLRRMMILDNELNPLPKIIQYLSGRAGASYCENNFQIFKGDTIAYEQLQDNNSDTELMVEMLTHYQKGNPLNIFLYGVEGTGKTELSKAIAKKLGKKLILTNLEHSGDNKDNPFSNKIIDKMSSILLASYTFRNDDAIILVDEADCVLNCCEKGELNGFLEKLDTPIIWISNNTEFIEASSLRRFDFSLKFERLDGSRRVDIWKSIVKTQKAEKLLDEETIIKLSSEIPVTAGGITQAIRTAKALKKAGSKLDPKDIVQRMTKAQADLLGLELEYNNRDTETHAPKYSIDILNTDADMKHLTKVIHNFDAKWQTFEEGDRPDSLNILLYGAPGTGKTEFARHIARELDRKLIIKRCSDLLDKYVGESEKNIRQMFKDAEEQDAILFLDEADSLIRDRRGATRNWEVSQVNEILTQMENFKGIFIAATNFNDNLDQASRRRFALKVKFGYLKPNAIPQVWNLFFPKVECPEEATRIRNLAPGDFNAVYGQLRFLDENEVTAQRILKELQNEVACKDDHEGRHMGFCA
ncbi:MAG: ATP-binding protein [Fibrobacter sp.]|nr:ATP-binding protein [Fibrobacter sp.]